MIDFQFSLPTNLVYGKEKHKEIGSYLKPFAKHVLVHYGSNRIEKSGLLKAVLKSLEAENITYTCLNGVQANPEIDLCRQGVEKCIEENVDTVLAIGGGSVIDSAKAISFGIASDEDLWKVINKPDFVPEKVLRIATIVTLPATGSEANGVCVISNHQEKKKVALSSSLLVPAVSILNPELTYTLPSYQTAIALVDIFSHCFERYFDLSREGMLWDALCEATMGTLIDLGNAFVDNPKDNRFRDEMTWAATVAHSNMLGPGGDFACHQLAHALTVAFNIPHGGALALIMPAWCRYVCSRHYERFQNFFKRVFKVNSVDLGIKAMENFFDALGATTQFEKYYDKDVDINNLIDIVYSKNRTYIGNGLEAIYPADAEKIFMSAINKAAS